MYFGYGFPRLVAAGTGRDEEWVHLQQDGQYMVAVSETSVSLWSVGLNRLRLSLVQRSQESIEQEGTNTAAWCCGSRGALAVLTGANFLHIYQIQGSREPLFPGSLLGARDVCRADIYLRHSAKLDCAQGLCISGSSRLLLVGCADGALASCTWTGKVNDIIVPLPLPEDSGSPDAHPNREDAGISASLGSAFAPSSPGIRGIHYCERSSSMALVMSDGSCALLSTPPTGITQLGDLAWSHWACGPGGGAACAAIGASAQLLAVGRRDGTVGMYRLHRPMVLQPLGQPPLGDTPVRTLSLAPWGHTRSQTGAVSQVSWAPDCRALAVGYAHHGVVVWSPSGCRLLCSLRQVPNTVGWDSQRLSSQTTIGDDLLSTSSVASGQLSPTRQQPDALTGHVPPLLDTGINCLCWGPHGYMLVLGHARQSSHLVELQFARSLPNNHRVSHAAAAGNTGLLAAAPYKRVSADGRTTGADGGSQSQSASGWQQLQQQFGEELHVLQAHDRLLVISEALQGTNNSGQAGGMQAGMMAGMEGGAEHGALSSSDLSVAHVPLPHSYISTNWPVTHAAVSGSGMDMAVAGRRGLALYSRASDRWRLFGDVSQERRIACRAVCWLGHSIVVVASGPSTPGSEGASSRAASGGPLAAASKEPTQHQLLLFPRYHLDFSSVLCQLTLAQPPCALDCVGRHVLIASEPLEIALYAANIKGQLSPAGKPSVSLQLVREMSMLDVGQPLRDIALVPLPPGPPAQQPQQPASNTSNSGSASTVSEAPAPHQCVLVRWGGLMSVLDMERGAETPLASEIEVFWLSDSLPCSPGVSSGLHTHSASGLQLPAPSSSLPSLPSAGNLAAGPEAQMRSGRSAAGLGPAGAPASQPMMSAAGLLESMADSGGQAAAAAAQQVLAPPPPLPAGPSEAAHQVEMPWWGYGPQGMQLWFPSTLAALYTAVHAGQQALIQPRGSTGGGGAPPQQHVQPTQQWQPVPPPQDIELEFDQEVYPVGISLADASIVGVTQRVVRGLGLGYAGEPLPGGGMALQPSLPGLSPPLPCFHPVPESQPVLPCLLRRLLQKGALAEAHALARRHESGPHFHRSLEWLLFTALEMESSKPLGKRPAKGHGRGEGFLLGRTPQGEASLTRGPSGAFGNSTLLPVPVSPLLMAAADLLRAFPDAFASCVVAVARKTDAALWPALFSAVGAPSALLEGLLEEGALGAAACFLLVIDRLEGATIAHLQALRLMRAALRRAHYPLVGELLRFVLPPGELDTGGPTSSSSLTGGVAGVEGGLTSAGSGGVPGSPFESREAQQRATGAQLQPSANNTSQGGGKKATGGGGWFAWLFGGDGGQGASAASGAAQGNGTADNAIGRFEDGSTRPLLQARRGRPSLAVAVGDGAPGSKHTAPLGSPPGNRLRGSASRRTTLSSMGSDGIAPASDARQLVADAGWGLLESGRLGHLVQLAAAVSFLPGGGLPGLMRSHGGSHKLGSQGSMAGTEVQAHGNGPSSLAELQPRISGGGGAAGTAAVTSVDLLSALALVSTEFPVWQQQQHPGVEADAAAALDIVRGLPGTQAAAWAVSLSILLVSQDDITRFAQASPKVWRDFVDVLKGDKTFAFLHELIGLLTERALPAESSNDSGGAAVVANPFSRQSVPEITPV